MKRFSRSLAFRASARSTRRAAKRFLDGRRGSSALEFALACTPLMLLVFGFVGVNTAMIAWTTMLNSAQNAAMAVANGTVTSWNLGANTNPSSASACSSATNSAWAEYYACQNLPTWGSYSTKVTISCGAGTTPSTVTATLVGSALGIADTYNFMNRLSLNASSTMVIQKTCP